MAPVTLRFGVTPVTTTVTELEDVVRVGDPTVGAATGILIGSGVALGSTERLLGSTSEIRVTVTVPATVPGLNCDLRSHRRRCYRNIDRQWRRTWQHGKVAGIDQRDQGYGNRSGNRAWAELRTVPTIPDGGGAAGSNRKSQGSVERRTARRIFCTVGVHHFLTLIGADHARVGRKREAQLPGRIHQQGAAERQVHSVLIRHGGDSGKTESVE